MRAPRSLLLILGGTALVVGAVLSFATYSVPLGELMTSRPGEKLMSAGMWERIRAVEFPCERPIRGAFREASAEHPIPGWLNYAPPNSVTFSPNDQTSGGKVPCPTSARWRLGGGVVLLLGGAVALVIWTRQSRLGREPESDGAAPGGTSPDPS